MSHMEPRETTFVTPAAGAKIVGRSPHDVDTLAQAGVIESIEKDERLYVSHAGLVRLHRKPIRSTLRRWLGGVR